MPTIPTYTEDTNPDDADTLVIAKESIGGSPTRKVTIGTLTKRAYSQAYNNAPGTLALVSGSYTAWEPTATVGPQKGVTASAANGSISLPADATYQVSFAVGGSVPAAAEIAVACYLDGSSQGALMVPAVGVGAAEKFAFSGSGLISVPSGSALTLDIRIHTDTTQTLTGSLYTLQVDRVL